MILGDLAIVTYKFVEDADFYLMVKGTIGKPVRHYIKGYICIKVTSSILNPDYLYYVMLAMYEQRVWEQYALGSVYSFLRVKDIRNIKIG